MSWFMPLGHRAIGGGVLTILLAMCLLASAALRVAAEARQRSPVEPDVEANALPWRSMSAPVQGEVLQPAIRQVTRQFDLTRLSAATVADWEDLTAGE